MHPILELASAGRHESSLIGSFILWAALLLAQPLLLRRHSVTSSLSLQLSTFWATAGHVLMYHTARTEKWWILAVFGLLASIGLQMTIRISQVLITSKIDVVDYLMTKLMLWDREKHELRRHPRFKDLLITFGNPLRPNETNCLICSGKMQSNHNTLTHTTCQYSFHKHCLERWHVQSAPPKCSFCQQVLLARTRSAEEEKLSKVVKCLRQTEENALKKSRSSPLLSESLRGRVVELQRVISAIEKQEAEGLGPGTTAVMAILGKVKNEILGKDDKIELAAYLGYSMGLVQAGMDSYIYWNS